MGRQVIWTNREREFLYRYLLGWFGPYKKWTNRSSPNGDSRGFQAKLEEIRSRLEKEFRINVSARAIQQQLEWAITTQPTIDRRHLRSFLLNKAAAVEVGFIDADDLMPWLSKPRKLAAR